MSEEPEQPSEPVTKRGGTSAWKAVALVLLGVLALIGAGAVGACISAHHAGYGHHGGRHHGWMHDGKMSGGRMPMHEGMMGGSDGEVAGVAHSVHEQAMELALAELKVSDERFVNAMGRSIDKLKADGTITADQAAMMKQHLEATHGS